MVEAAGVGRPGGVTEAAMAASSVGLQFPYLGSCKAREGACELEKRGRRCVRARARAPLVAVALHLSLL